ncbi:MAG: hypothetical protein IJK23_10405 [Clostridia bacterium]|nr:hypothetical protein [Clostridia bacterium]
MKISKLIRLAFGAIALGTAVETALQIMKKPAQELPDDKDFDYYSADADGRKFEDLYLFLTGQGEEKFTEEQIFRMLSAQADYLAHRFDCADFRAQLLFKIYKDCSETLSGRCRDLIRDTFLGFKYFMDEPGDDSMCYWSENHQILFAVSEYLAGQEWENEIFTNNGMTGRQHKEKAEERIRAWIRQRFAYGFSEYLSNNYLAEDLAPMANFIAYADDRALREDMRTVMHILWLDVALNSVGNRFVAVSSRMYGNNKAANCCGNSIQAAMNALWGQDAAAPLLADPDLPEDEKEAIRASLAKKPGSIVLCFTDIVKKGIYTLPPAIRDIALTREPIDVRMGCGLSPDDLVSEGLVGQEPYQVMAQFGAETFTNPQVIRNTVRYFKSNDMFRNAFIHYFRFLDVSFLRFVDPAKFAARHELPTHGIATWRGNVYTYRTARYALSTVVNGTPGRSSAQDHEWSANIAERVALFSTHPAGSGENRCGSSPGYWIGNGRRPMSAQHKNVNITIYRLPDRRRLGETAVARMTHLYLPRDLYDEVILEDNAVFARKNGVFAAVLSNGPLIYKPYDKDTLAGLFKNLKKADLSADYVPKEEFDLCRFGGEYHAYITELSDVETEDFDSFIARIRNNRAVFENGTAEYNTRFGELAVSYDGLFAVNGKEVKLPFDRYDCKFCRAERKADSIFVDSGKNMLTLSLRESGIPAGSL